jgi:hypothetical protein
MSASSRRRLAAPVLSSLILVGAVAAAAQNAPRPGHLPSLDYPLEALLPGPYDPAVPTQEAIVGFAPGARAATPEEIERCLAAWRDNPRAKVVEYARSHEGRPLHYVVVTSPANQARLDDIRAAGARLADPRGLGERDAHALADDLPAVAWLAYSIHGNETSGSDAALALLYHLLAGTGPDVTALLDEVVVLVDPTMNPDGRARHLAEVRQMRSTTPNLDDQSVLHSGTWPYGRGNHYLFDLNRDWILGTQPESRGRIRAAAEWQPLLFVDAHEMGSQDTFLFSPQRAPVNPHTPAWRARWAETFAAGQAAAFDRMAWPYYTGEWNEGWYPGYSDAWAQQRGAVGILYEQANVVEDGVRQGSGGVLTYREAVHHQLTASLANLETLRQHGDAMQRERLEDRREALSAGGSYAGRAFAVLPGSQPTRFRRFAELMALQGFEAQVLERAATVRGALDAFGERRDRELPAGTLLFANGQPHAHLLASMLELDTPLTPDYVARERGELLRRGESTIYDVTAWNVPLMYGLETFELSAGLPAGAAAWSAPAPPAAPALGEGVAWVIDGADDGSVAAAARLAQRGIQVRVAERPLRFAGRDFARGSVVVSRYDQGGADPRAALAEVAAELQLAVEALPTGLAPGDDPDLGGGWLQRLEAPRVALLSGGGTSGYDFGALWHLLDTRLGIRHSHLAESDLAGFADLRRYNVLVLPDRWGGELSAGALEKVKTWVQQGGTLIAVGDQAAQIAREGSGLGSVRQLGDVLEDLDRYETQVMREIAASRGDAVPADQLWSHSVPAQLAVPWDGRPAEPRLDPKELARRDEHQRLFMPAGALLAARVDDESWLTFGLGDWVPLITRRQPVLMTAAGAEAPIRFGVFAPRPGAKAVRAGWAAVPEGQELRLRLSGLLWPEAAHRLASSAWVTRESLGRGQVILFAGETSFRATTLAAERVMANALVYGPAFVDSAPVVP